jgi:hypothetical protein
MLATGVEERKATHEQVVTMALSFKGARQLRVLHRRQESIVTEMALPKLTMWVGELGKA